MSKFVIPDKIIKRIKKLTELDLENKSNNELWASLLEELGEYARELKIEKKVFGNTYKTPDEGTHGELVDIFICAAALYFAQNGKLYEGLFEFELLDSLPVIDYEKEKPKDEFDCLQTMTRYAAEYNTLHGRYSMFNLATYSASLYCLNKTPEEFVDYCTKKLNKWEKNGTFQPTSVATTP